MSWYDDHPHREQWLVVVRVINLLYIIYITYISHISYLHLRRKEGEKLDWSLFPSTCWLDSPSFNLLAGFSFCLKGLSVRRCCEAK